MKLEAKQEKKTESIAGKSRKVDFENCFKASVPLTVFRVETTFNFSFLTTNWILLLAFLCWLEKFFCCNRRSSDYYFWSDSYPFGNVHMFLCVLICIYTNKNHYGIKHQKKNQMLKKTDFLKLFDSKKPISTNDDRNYDLWLLEEWWRKMHMANFASMKRKQSASWFGDMKISSQQKTYEQIYWCK